MIETLAISGYRSLRDIVVSLGRLTIVTGANGSGKTSLYRSLRLLAETAQGRLVGALANEGGLASALWAGPETIAPKVRSGVYPVEGTVRKAATSLKLGFSGQEAGYAVDLGFPVPPHPFPLDPAIKLETLWAGTLPTRTSLVAERRGPLVRVRSRRTGEWREVEDHLSSSDAMMTHCAEPGDGAELLDMRERLRNWRFYDALRTDPEAPARRPQVMTYTPVLASDGADLAAALTTIRAIGDQAALDDAVEHAFPGSRLHCTTGVGGGLRLSQHGLLRPLSAPELSDGTLRYLLLVAALLSPRPPELMVLNEPEGSLHLSLMPPLARLLALASRRGQIVLVSHSDALITALRAEHGAGLEELRLAKDFGETRASDSDAPRWIWPKR